MKTYQQKGNNFLLILNQRTSAKILISKLILIKSYANYTKFYVEDSREKVVAHTLKFFEPHLETHGFLRVHRSYMINPNHIQTYDSTEESFMMTDGQKVKISKRKKRTLKILKRGRMGLILRDGSQ